MSIYYKMTTKTDTLNPEDSKKQGYYPRTVSRETTGLRTLCERAAEGTTFNPFELKTAVGLLVEQILNELANGNNVCIEEFGTFSITAQAKREVTEKDEIRAESVSLKRLVFKASQALTRRLRNFKFQKLPDE